MRTLLVALLCGGMAVAAEWPQWGGPDRAFSAASGAELADWGENGPAVAWRREVGPGYAGLVADDERLYVLTRSGDRELVLALSAADGRTLWEHGYDAPVAGGVDTSWGAGPDATPLLTDGLLITLGFTGKAHALDAATGEVRWSLDLVGEHGGGVPYFGVSPSPLRVGERLILLAGRAFGVEAATGKLLWRNDDFFASYASPLAVDAGQVVVAGAGEVVGLEPREGKLLWRVEHANRHRTILSSPVAAGERIFASAYFLGSIGLTRGEDGSYRKRWENEVQLSHTNALRIGETVYGFHDDTLCAIDLAGGEVLWRDEGLERGNLLQVGDRTLIVGEAGALQAVTLGPKGAAVNSSTRLLDERVWAAPALVGSRLYMRDTATVVAVDLDRRAEVAPTAVRRTTVAIDQVDPETAKAFLEAKRALGTAYLQEDMAALQTSRARFERWIEHETLAHLAHYYIGFAYWQESLVAPRDRRVALTDAAVEALEAAVAVDRNFADAHALLGNVYPAYYRLDPRRAAVIAMRGDEHLALARRLAPDDPRLQLFVALDLLRAPAQHGGDPVAGMAGLEAALERFATAPAENSGLDPDWGDAFAWSRYAQALIDAGRTEEGAAAAREARERRSSP